jgi:glycoside/pentoside/hexuronide:cation symporter, GPH family
MSGASTQRLPLGRLIVFSLSTLAYSAMGVVLFVFLPPYLAAHIGVSLTTIGGIWASVRLVDLAIDPLLGHLMDRTDTRFGRYRVWLVAGVPVFMLSTYMLFFAPVGSSIAYLFFWLFVFYVGNSVVVLSQQAWSATLATDYSERARVFGATTAVGIVAIVVSLLIPVIGPKAGLSSNQAVLVMGLAIIAMTPLGIGPAAIFTPERVNRSASRGASLRDYLEIILKPEVIRLFLAQVTLTLGPGWMSAMYIFYFNDVMGFSQSQSSLLLLAYILVGIAGAPLTARLASRIGRHRSLMLTTAAFSLGLLSVLVVPKGNLWAGMPAMLWCGFMAAGFNMAISAMMADVGDEIRLAQGKERISLLYAVLSFASKLTAALSIWLTFTLLDYFGYVAKEGAHNTPAALHALQWLFIAGPILFVMLGGVCVWGWRLDAKRHAAIRAELEARDALLEEAAILTNTGARPSPAILTAEGEA